MNTTIIADNQLLRYSLSQSPVPLDWSSRSLYIGDDGKRNWMGVLQEENYPLHRQHSYSLETNRLAALEKVCPRTMVSLGPGDGQHDIELVRALKVKQTEMVYIPVEICQGLLELAIANLQDHVDIPVGLLCDFEADQPMLHDALAQHAHRPILFSLLGGTLGNLDLGESHFFARMRKLMQPCDTFLLDVPLAGPAWTAHEDPRMDKTKFTEGFKRLLAGGLKHRDPGLRAETGLGWFDERIECLVSDQPSIAGSKIISVRDRITGGVLLRFCRYHWSSVRRWFQTEGFEVGFAESSLSSPEDKFGMGVILLAKNEQPI
jgi:hypothetical protein